MVHPVFALLINQPDLVMNHATAYAALVRDEAMDLGEEAVQRALAWVATLVLAAAFLVLAGTACMLGALQAQFHWALMATPGVVLALAVAAWARARQPLAPNHFSETRAQLAADAQALQLAGDRS